MSKRPNNQKTVKGPNAMPAPRRAPNPRTPKPAPNVRSTGAQAGGGSQSDGTGGNGNQ